VTTSYKIIMSHLGEDYGSEIWRCDDDEPVAFIAADGGDPEDQTFQRDLCWIAPALQYAYERGLAE
jgi:hypothetical protein